MEMATVPQPNDDNAAESPQMTLSLNPTTETLLKEFDATVNRTTINTNRCLRILVEDLVLPPDSSGSSDSNSNSMKLSPNLVLDYLFLRVVKDGNTFGKRDLWAYALLLNRTNTPRNDARFTRVQFIFSKVISHLGAHKTRPQAIAELEVIKNHLVLHLNIKRNEPDTTLTSIESELESTYFQIYSARKESPPHTWDSLVNAVLSKISFEQIYPPEKLDNDSPRPKFSLFLVNGKLVPIKAPIPVKRLHPWENVVEINDKDETREAFTMFMEQFLLHMDDPSVTPGLMRSMILIIVDLVDVVILYKLGTFANLFGVIGCGKNMVEPNLFSKGLFKLWVWTGVMSNPLHNRGENGLKLIRVLQKKLSVDLHKNRRAAEFTALRQRVLEEDSDPGAVSDFHSFLELLGKFYPSRSKKESRTLSCNELEEMYLNIRLNLVCPPPHVFNHHFVKPRLCATSGKYCSRLITSRDSAIERMEVEEICTVCDSSSDEESEGQC